MLLLMSTLKCVSQELKDWPFMRENIELSDLPETHWHSLLYEYFNIDPDDDNTSASSGGSTHGGGDTRINLVEFEGFVDSLMTSMGCDGEECDNPDHLH